MSAMRRLCSVLRRLSFARIRDQSIRDRASASRRVFAGLPSGDPYKVAR